MDKNNFINFANQYYNSRRQLENDINNSQYIRKNVCYLIEESWIQNLDVCVNNYNKGEYSHHNVIPFPREPPKFINDFSTAVNYIKNKKNFKIISQELIDLLYGRKDIIRANAIYYVGNNKLIIEIKENDKNNALFFIDPSNSFRNNNDIFIILKNNISNIYQELMILDNVEYVINKNPKYNNYVIHFEKFINKNFNNIIPLQTNNINNIILIQNFHNREPLNIIKSTRQSNLNNSNSNKKNFGSNENIYKKSNIIPNSKIKSKSPNSRNPNLSHNINVFCNSSDNFSNNQNSIIAEDYKLKQDKFMNYIKNLENKINTLQSEVNNKDNMIKILQNNDKNNELAKNKQFQKLLGLKENEILHYKNQLDILNKEIQSQKN